MSLVGPRPLLTEYLNHYTPEQMRRHDVLPGLTGWAQVHGRNAIRWEEKFALDLWYVDHCSFGLDLRILAKTVAAAVLRKNISLPGYATTQAFTGTDASAGPHNESAPIAQAGIIRHRAMPSRTFSDDDT
jgi:hypothetical protein